MEYNADEEDFLSGMTLEKMKLFGGQKLHPTLYSGYFFLDDEEKRMRGIYEPREDGGLSLRRVIDY